MLARFDDEETLTARNTAEELLLNAAAVQDQAGVIELALDRREQAQRRLAPCLLLPEQASLADIISLLPQYCQSLVRALADENAALSARVQCRARQRRRLPLRPASSVAPEPTYQATEHGHLEFVLVGCCENTFLGVPVEF